MFRRIRSFLSFRRNQQIMLVIGNVIGIMLVILVFYTINPNIIKFGIE